MHNRYFCHELDPSLVGGMNTRGSLTASMCSLQRVLSSGELPHRATAFVYDNYVHVRVPDIHHIRHF